MAGGEPVVIDLGTKDELTLLYSYPNKPGSAKKESLPKTIQHWWEQTLKNDGFTGAKAATAEVVAKGTRFELHLTGPKSLKEYQIRLPKFLDHGRAALKRIDEIKEEDKSREKQSAKKPVKKHWDPRGIGDWRFFLPHGLAMVNQRSIQFFHYPPIRLLETNRDYLDDPVPKRWEELLVANGVPGDKVALYEAVMDAVPVGASDKEGSAEHGGMPIEDFTEYQKTQVELLLNRDSKKDGFTIPIVVYGSNPRAQFQSNYRDKFPEHLRKAKSWKVGDPQTLELTPGCKTPVLAVNHPYAFFMSIQKMSDKDEFTPGIIQDPKLGFFPGIGLMIESLVTARWQVKMAADPSQSPTQVFEECQDYWGWLDVKAKKYVKVAAKQAQRDTIAALILHQASLNAGLTGEWDFMRSLPAAEQLVKQFKKGDLAATDLLAGENVKKVNDILRFVCSPKS